MPQALPAKTLGTPFIELKSVDSTNNYARARIGTAQTTGPQSDISDGTTFFAHEQYAGKGQRGQEWTSTPGMNIAMSIVLKPYPLSISRQFQLSAIVALSVFEIFKKYAGDDTAIKWPNDLYWQDRKAGGILIESIVKTDSVEPDWTWAIIGIGININQTEFPNWLPNPVSLKQITGMDHDPLILAHEICDVLSKKFDSLNHDGFDPLLEQYNSQLFKKNQLTRFKKENRVFEATILGVEADGKLRLKHAIEEEFSFGTIQFADP